LNENVPLKLHSNEIPHGKQQHKAVKKINYLGGIGGVFLNLAGWCDGRHAVDISPFGSDNDSAFRVSLETVSLCK
jgi:hypothetical protein